MIAVGADHGGKVVYISRRSGKAATTEWVDPLTQVSYDAAGNVLAIEFHNALLPRRRGGQQSSRIGTWRDWIHGAPNI